MPSDLDRLISILAPLIVLWVVAVWLWLSLRRIFRSLRSRFRRRYPPDQHQYNPAYPPFWTPAPEDSWRTLDAADQLRIVMRSDFSARAILNQSEARVFDEVCEILAHCKPTWRVMAQVSLGEILSSEDPDAYGCINAKRVDMLLIDERRRPRHAIEYQGGGHYQGNAAARDAVKKEALRRAGIGYHEVVAGKTTPGELRQLVESLLARPEPSE